jgi:anti-sigma regulatory factor (Ser/Thr protein kinase)
VPIVRRAVTEYAKACGGFDGAALSDIELAVGEALANAVEHGHSDGGWIAALCACREDALEVTISDNGPGFDHAQWVPAVHPRERPRGFGITMMRQLMDQVNFQSSGRAVTLVKYLTPTSAVREVPRRS